MPTSGPPTSAGDHPSGRRQGTAWVDGGPASDLSARHHRSIRTVLVAMVVVAAAGAVVAAALLGGDTPETGTSGPGQPVKGPGTPIVGGLEVRPGSVLLGTPFPGPIENDRDERWRRWRAVLRVRTDPIPVHQGYVDEMTDRSIGLDPGTPAGPCLVPDTVAPDEDQRQPPNPVCATIGARGSVYLWRTQTEPGHARVDQLVLTVDTQEIDDGASTTRASAPAERPTASAGAGRSELRVPRAGERISPVAFDPMSEPVRVVEGSTVLAPAAPAESITGGYVVVVRIDGDPEDTVARYVNQSREPWDEPITREEYEVDGRPVLRSWWSVAGGPKLFVTATTDERGDWYALIDVSND